jgi:hypothetical protein
MKKFAFIVLVFVASTTLPLFLSMNPSSTTADVMSADETTTDTIPTIAPTPELPPLTDITGHWAEGSIQALYEKGVVSGYGNELFGPNDVVTRAQVMKMALEAFAETDATSTSSNFSDVSSTDWFSTYVATGTAIGIVNGYEDGSFKPDKTVTRAEALKIILEAAGFTDLSDTSGNFTDLDSVRDWFAKYSAFAKKAGIVSGYNDGTFRGNSGITRAEVCVIIQKVIDYLGGQE